MDAALRFKVASEPWEFEAIARMNHRTFAEEIPQHHARPDGLLVDKFHAENTYLIALKGTELAGMLCVRARRPFSLDAKLPDLDRHLPPGRSACEIRLLSIAPEHRGGAIFHGLLTRMGRFCLDEGHDLALISGTVRQLKLYRHVGFEPFGPLVGDAEAQYQPMYLTRETFQERFPGLAPTLNLSPGPVHIAPEIRRALARPPVSSRSEGFHAVLDDCRARLCRLSGMPHAQILVGSGTLANDVVGAQLSLEPGRGLVLSNGEFGDRLIDHAQRFRLDCETHARPWGEALDLEAVARKLDAMPEASWVWAVHSETSTGFLNNLEGLKALCRTRGLKLALDCMSSLGVVPLDLSGVAWATCSSGKALGSFPGLAVVLHREAPATVGRLPRYLDLGTWQANDGVPFTHSSNLVMALATALDRFDGEGPFARLAALGAALREGLEARGFRVLAPRIHAHPCVFTLEVPEGLESEELGHAFEEAGILVSYASGYLQRKRWFQLCVLVPFPEERLEGLLAAVEAICRPALVEA